MEIGEANVVDIPARGLIEESVDEQRGLFNPDKLEGSLIRLVGPYVRTYVRNKFAEEISIDGVFKEFSEKLESIGGVSKLYSCYRIERGFEYEDIDDFLNKARGDISRG